MTAVYDADPGEVFWAASDVGWVVGHSYIVYAPLLAGCTTVLYEGKPVGTPDAGAFWRVVAEHGVRGAVHRADRVPGDPQGRPGRASSRPSHDLSRLRALFLAGERLDPETYRWAGDLLGIPVIDHWWQTETGWPIAANPLGLEPLPAKAGLADRAGARLGRAGPRRRPASRRRRTWTARWSIRLPLPPGALPTLWRRRRAVRRRPTCPATRATT